MITVRRYWFSRAPGRSALLSLPFLLIEPGRGRLIEEGVMRSVAHGARSLGPAGARSPRRLDYKPSRLSMQFDLVGELRLIEEELWDANPT